MATISSSFLRKTISFLALGVLLGAPAFPREDPITCGSHGDRLSQEVHLHRKARIRRLNRARAVGLQSAESQTAKRKATSVRGEIVLMEDADGVVSRRNAFDLDHQTISFLRNTTVGGNFYRFTTTTEGYDEGLATAGERLTGISDDDSKEMAIPFPFPFYGETYSSVHVNSDGNLTFNQGDSSTDPRSLDRLTSGPPRIAALFRDLDPPGARDGIRVFSNASQFVVSWVSVPQFSSFGTGALQTFQIRLFPDGRIDFSYNGITTTSAIVGISPGNLDLTTRIVSFSDGSNEDFPGAVAERFTSIEEVDILLATQKFYEEHDDAYDYLVYYNNLGIDADLGTVAYEITLRNHRTGIGDRLADFGHLVGSANRLQAFLNLGPLRQYPEDPNALVPRRAIAGDTPLTVLSHEAGHLFLAFASVRGPNDPSARPMLGRDRAHWNFVFNSEASLLEGNRICDRERTPAVCPSDPQQRRFVTVATVEGYSPLDQYLMGLRAPWDVPDTFVVENPTIFGSGRMPQAGVAFNGDRRDIRIDELIAAEGPRTPDFTVSQRRFRFAFILIHAAGVQPSDADFEKVDRFRRDFETFYAASSNNRAVAVTTLRSGLRLSTRPASGVLLGGSATVSLTLESPATESLEVVLTSLSGGVRVPPSLTIPPGAATASFSITGAREGVDELIAEIPGFNYEQARSRIQVLSSAAALTLAPVSGHRQPSANGAPLPDPVIVRLSDRNNLPYPGVTLNATLSEGGTVTPTAIATDENGRASFTWAPASADEELLLSVSVGAGAPSLTITTTGLPAFTADAVVNAATFTNALSPGSLATIFGRNLAAGATAVAQFPIPIELEGVRVVIRGLPAQLLYISDAQINFVVPLGTPPGATTFAITTPLGNTAPATVTIDPVSPGIFVMPGTGLGAVAVAGTGKLTSEIPAAPGDFVEIFCTGLGSVVPISGSSIRRTVSTPEVTINGVPAEVTFSGLAPGWVGLYQVNAKIPPGTPSGAGTLILTIDGIPSNPVLILIR